MNISDETWERALDCAARQFESYVRQGKLATQEERRIAIGDALQHAVGIIQMAALDVPHAPMGIGEQSLYDYS